MNTVARPIAEYPFPVTLQTPETSHEIGVIQVPITYRDVSRDAGHPSVELSIDQLELRRRIADLLKVTAMHFEEGPTDG